MAEPPSAKPPKSGALKGIGEAGQEAGDAWDDGFMVTLITG